MASITRRRTSNGQSRYDVRYWASAGTQRSQTFRTRKEAERCASTVEADQHRGAWIDPRAGRITFAEYAERWMDQHKDRHRPRTRDLYAGLLRNHIEPTFADVPVSRITTAAVREWHADKLAHGSAPSIAAKSYRLLRTILATAVEDDLLARNPCTIKGAGVERPAERPVASPEQVWALADAVGPRYRALILLATYGSLRLGECAALRRRHVDLLHKPVRIEAQRQQLDSGKAWEGPPKSEAGKRTVALPTFLAAEIEKHLDAHTDPEPNAYVFTSPHGAPLDRNNWNKRFRQAAAQMDGLPAGFRFHDLRGTGATLAAQAGASLRELMSRLGHASPRAALIYQHGTSERDQTIAAALDRLAVSGQ
jgi:integrase